MSRLDKWKKVWRLPIGLIGEDKEVIKLAERRWEKLKKKRKEEPGLLWRMIQASKELIFDIVNDKVIFHMVDYSLDSKTFELVVEPSFEISGLDTDDGIKSILAIAMALEVPVYHNTKDHEPELIRYHKDLLTHGFKEKDRSGKEVHIIPTKYQDVSLDNLELINKVKSQEMLTPAEILIMKGTVLKKIEEQKEAGYIIASLRSAIKELSTLLDMTKRINKGSDLLLAHLIT